MSSPARACKDTGHNATRDPPHDQRRAHDAEDDGQ